ncbi:DUF167 domain-containing protein [Candidatus Saccharibacteria bacterium]|nr:DUF167 domain-containing protein [Candidatus Saccharibacteria bacterium]
MRIKVRVKPGTSQEKIVRVEEKDGFDENLVVYLRAKAHDGEANAALVKLIAKYFNVPKTSIKIVRGERGREKVLEFNGAAIGI